MQLIVLGMHRSGTSSVTRLLNLAGAYFGPEGIATEANAENPKGFWERRDVREVCDGLLRGGGFDWWKVAGFEVDEIPEEVRQERLEQFTRIVHELDAHRPWVLKEPRLCLLSPVLRPALESPVFIHVEREPLEIAASLAARNNFPLPVGVALWEVYTAHAWKASAPDPRVVVAFGDLIRDPVVTTTRLVGELQSHGVQGLRVPSAREIEAFITPSLHRQRRTAADHPELLNLRQAALASATGRLERDDVRISAGALATLRSFEAHQADLSNLEVARREADVERTEAATAFARAERARAAVTDELEAARRSLERTLAELDALRASTSGELAAAAETAGRAADALDAATRRLHALERSGALRLGARISAVRARLKHDRALGVDAAIGRALQQVNKARSLLREPAEASAGVLDDDEPPPAEEQRATRRAARARGDRAKVAVVAWDIGHNPFARAHLLADVLSDRFDVELWGSQFERYGADIWLPLRGTSIPVRWFPGRSFPGHLDAMEAAARHIDADAIYVSKPRLPSLALGVMAKERWNRPLVVDIDDFEPSFFAEDAGIELENLARHLGDPDLELPFGRLWTLACESVVAAADQVTVSNLELQARYGGVVVPHVRDETVFDPARFDRTEVRRQLGLGPDDRLVLFGGTARAHKGIVELLEAIDHLGDDRVRVGAFPTRELEELRPRMGGLDRWILPLPHRAFSELPRLIAAADLACALQSPDHPVSRYQIPAKVTDAMAMGIPCLVTPVPTLQPLIDKDVVEVFDGDVPLHERVRDILDDRDAATDRASRARDVFLESYSYAAVRPVIAARFEELLGNPPPLAPSLGELAALPRRLFGSERSPPPPARPRRPLAPGAMFDLVILWKQNDTGIYGRRQDMFLKYLARSGRFGTIVHFDHPISAESLTRVARRSISGADQHRLVLAQTVRRLLHRADHGAIHHRTYVYAAGRGSRALRLPPGDRFPDYVQSVLQREGLGRRPLMVWVYPTNTMAPAIVDALRPDVVVADVVDDNRTWYEPDTAGFQRVERNYAEVLARSDVVLANCEPVATSMRAFTSRVHVVPNACEPPEPAAPSTRPRQLSGLRGPVIGYAGNLSDRIDIPLLRHIVRARRDWNLVLMGSAHLDRAALALADEPNVRFLGAQPYERARQVIRHFDVGLIPHLDNEMTRSMNPLKAYVYCSLGVPVVSTPVANIDELAELISVADDPRAFVAAIEAAIAAGPRPLDDAVLRPHSWETRVDAVLALVDEAVTTRASLTS